MKKERLQELAGIDQLNEGKTENVFFTKLREWGDLLLKHEEIKRREKQEGWTDEIEEEMSKLNFDKLRGPLHTALDRFAMEVAKKAK